MSNLTKLTDLRLQDNKISDIAPLIQNTGISGEIKLKGNPLSNTAYTTHIPALKARGITVDYDALPAGTVTFKDTNLEKAIRDALGIPTELLKKEDLAELKELRYNRYKYVNEEWLEKPKEVLVSDLTGIEYATNLKILSINHNKISNIEPIKDLSNLVELYLEGNAVNDILPLQNLTQLEVLILAGNGITDISALADLTMLKNLNLSGTPIEDSSILEGLTQLTALAVDGTGIQDLSFIENMSQLQSLWAPANPLYNSTLHKQIPNLKEREVSVEFDMPEDIFLPFNDISLEKTVRTALNIPTELLTEKNTLALTVLNMENTSVVDLDMEALKSLPSLKSINLTNNPLSSNAVIVQIPELESAGITVDLGTSAAAKVELSAEKSSIPASLASTTDITVTVTDASGRAVKRG